MTLQQTESFVPLTAAPAAGDRRETRVTVISQATEAKPFQSLSPVAAPPTGPAPPPAKIGEPRVMVQREGDRISGIRVHCTCGQVMDLACVYEPEAKPA